MTMTTGVPAVYNFAGTLARRAAFAVFRAVSRPFGERPPSLADRLAEGLRCVQKATRWAEELRAEDYWPGEPVAAARRSQTSSRHRISLNS